MTISTLTDRQTIHEKLTNIGNCLTRAADERDLIKDILDELHDQFPEITKKQFRKLAKVLHTQTFATETADFEEFELLYQNVTNLSGAQPPA